MHHASLAKGESILVATYLEYHEVGATSSLFPRISAQKLHNQPHASEMRKGNGSVVPFNLPRYIVHVSMFEDVSFASHITILPIFGCGELFRREKEEAC